MNQSAQMHSQVIEEGLISAVLEMPKVLMDILDETSAEAFYHERTRTIFECIIALHDRQESINISTVCSEVRKRGFVWDLEINDLVMKHPAWYQDARRQAKILQGYAHRRSIHEAGLELMRSAGDETRDLVDIMEGSEKLLFALRRTGSISSVRDTPSVLASILGQYTASQELARNGKVVGVTSGNADIDKLTLGWQGGKLIILAARPSVGKSAIAVGFAFDAKEPVLIFSLEMEGEEVVERRLMPDAGVSAYKARSGYMKAHEWDAVNAESAKMARESKVFIDDRAGLTITEVKSTARAMVLKHGIKLIIVDYLQLAYGSGGNKSTNREQEVASISRGLKELAKELSVPVIALSQLNRTKRHDERPDLRDLRESGSIEQDADIVMFAWRDPDIDGEKNPVLNWCFDKHRGGALGGGKLCYLPNTAKIVAYYEDDQRKRYGGDDVLPF